VKRLKELKNRQPVRKRDAILAAILYIVCRDEGSPRTFSEICTASGVRRGDIGAYYRLMLKVLKPSKAFTASARDTDAEAFMVCIVCTVIVYYMCAVFERFLYEGYVIIMTIFLRSCQ
jgi:transcription initiation factor TFIIIB Brf1 subunit/transcription initiation factor TFIIB